MYQQVVPLSADRFSGVGLMPLTDFQIAANEVTASVILAEFSLLIREYPIVFPINTQMPCVLLGIEDGKNAYVNTEGQWLAHTIPLSIQRYPLFLDAGEPAPGSNERTYKIGIDADAPQLSTTEGERLFNPDGSHGPALVQKLEILKTFEQGKAVTMSFVQALKKHDLLVDKKFLIKGPSGEQTGVTGIQMVDEAKLNDLSSEAFNELRQNNYLPFIYAHLFSINNLRHGVIGGRYPIPTTPTQAEPDPGFKLGDDDIIRFDQ